MNSIKSRSQTPPRFLLPDFGLEILPTDEFYRILYSNMKRRFNQKEKRTIGITSAVKGEGKTTTIVQLSKVIARDFEKRILLIEGDIISPRVRLLLGLPMTSSPGIVNTGLEGLDVLFLEHIGEKEKVNGPEFVRKIRKVIESFSGSYDHVLIDCPPVLPLVDTRMIAEAVDGIVLVIEAEGPARSLIGKALSSLPGEKVIGFVLNKITFNEMNINWPYL